MEERTTKGSLLNRFIDSMYHGSVSNMMVALLGNEKTSAEDLQKVKELLNKMETEGSRMESEGAKMKTGSDNKRSADKKS